MSYTWTAPAFKAAIVTAVAARAGIIAFDPKVRVLTYAPSIDEPITDLISVGYSFSDSNDPAALGANRYDEIVDIRCGIRVVRPGAGAAVSEAAEARAVAILNEITTEVQANRPDVGDQTLAAHVTNRSGSVFPYSAGSVAVRVCEIEFSIVYKARTSTP